MRRGVWQVLKYLTAVAATASQFEEILTDIHKLSRASPLVLALFRANSVLFLLLPNCLQLILFLTWHSPCLWTADDPDFLTPFESISLGLAGGQQGLKYWPLNWAKQSHKLKKLTQKSVIGNLFLKYYLSKVGTVGKNVKVHHRWQLFGQNWGAGQTYRPGTLDTETPRDTWRTLWLSLIVSVLPSVAQAL